MLHFKNNPCLRLLVSRSLHKCFYLFILFTIFLPISNTLNSIFFFATIGEELFVFSPPPPPKKGEKAQDQEKRKKKLQSTYLLSNAKAYKLFQRHRNCCRQTRDIREFALRTLSSHEQECQ